MKHHLCVSILSMWYYQRLQIFVYLNSRSLKCSLQSSVISQEHLNNLIFKFVISTMQTLRIVEEPSFIALIKGSQPRRRVLSRLTLKLMLNKKFEEMRLNLRNEL